ncbi:hypothetical protein [Vibrio sp. S12_S33]|uniref:hypothetical protein n=1 Tax=Vibrio sp. S12_S33 TaxID=2720223 RepID=UPI00177C7A93|nr:hypothetical protein [Vibrio sp. S12_S33]MBD1567585.1 hypothetical protein [Vibrio sp. S12_S33]
MKNVVGLVASSLILLSVQSIASPDDFVKKTGDQFYIGADVAVANSIDVSINGESVDESA